MRSVVFALAALVMATSEGAAAALDEYKACKDHVERHSDGKWFDMGVCIGKVSSVFFFSQVLDEDNRFCVPKNATVGQLARITVKYMEDHPELLHLELPKIIAMAGRKAFPCR